MDSRQDLLEMQGRAWKKGRSGRRGCRNLSGGHFIKVKGEGGGDGKGPAPTPRNREKSMLPEI